MFKNDFVRILNMPIYESKLVNSIFGDIMSIIEKGQTEGEFNGFKDNNTIFKFFGGNAWQQDEYKYNYHYEYMPKAKVFELSGEFYLEIETMNDKVKVKKI